MTRQLDTITTQLGNIQAVVATLPTFPALETVLGPINVSLRHLSQRVSAAPSPKRQPLLGVQFPRLVSPYAPLPCQHKPRQKRALLPLTGATPGPSTRTYPGMNRTPALSTETPGPTRPSSQTRGKPTRFVRGSTLTPLLSSPGISPTTIPNPSHHMPRLPLLVLRRVRRLRAPSQPLKSRQLASSSLSFRHRSCSPQPREGSTLPVPPPPNTHKPP